MTSAAIETTFGEMTIHLSAGYQEDLLNIDLEVNPFLEDGEAHVQLTHAQCEGLIAQLREHMARMNVR